MKRVWFAIVLSVLLLVCCGCSLSEMIDQVAADFGMGDMPGMHNTMPPAHNQQFVPTAAEEPAESYALYWNVDRALYDGKSEAGMSSREPAEDGYFHVRFFKDGGVVELRVADRKTVNLLEVYSLMGLEMDEDGIVVGVINIDDMACEKMAWGFCVQSSGNGQVKLNSSLSFNGMEVVIQVDENTAIYDMTGNSGSVGSVTDLERGDLVYAIGDGNGSVTHIFVYEREVQ